MQSEQLISWFPLFVVGVAALISLYSFSLHYPITLKWLSLLWIFNFLIDMTGHIMKELHTRNHWIYNIYNWILYLSLAYLYHEQIKIRYIRNIIQCFYVVFLLLIIIDSAFIEEITSMQSLIIVTGGSFIIFLAATYFYEMYTSNEKEKTTRDPWFWFSSGFIINFGCTIPFMGMLNYLWENDPKFTSFYYLYISNSFTILLNILIIAGFLCRKSHQKSL